MHTIYWQIVWVNMAIQWRDYVSVRCVSVCLCLPICLVWLGVWLDLIWFDFYYHWQNCSVKENFLLYCSFTFSSVSFPDSHFCGRKMQTKQKNVWTTKKNMDFHSIFFPIATMQTIKLLSNFDLSVSYSPVHTTPFTIIHSLHPCCQFFSQPTTHCPWYNSSFCCVCIFLSTKQTFMQNDKSCRINVQLLIRRFFWGGGIKIIRKTYITITGPKKRNKNKKNSINWMKNKKQEIHFQWPMNEWIALKSINRLIDC